MLTRDLVTVGNLLVFLYSANRLFGRFSAGDRFGGKAAQRLRGLVLDVHCYVRLLDEDFSCMVIAETYCYFSSLSPSSLSCHFALKKRPLCTTYE